MLVLCVENLYNTSAAATEAFLKAAKLYGGAALMFYLSRFINFLNTPVAGEATAAPENSTVALLIQIAPFAVLIVVFYFLLIRPQRKREKQENDMRANLVVGDVVTTRGGIIGTIRQIKDDNIVIETGANNVRITVARWAIGSKEEKLTN
jgi:preprotein translocase subunit YajC